MGVQIARNLLFVHLLCHVEVRLWLVSRTCWYITFMAQWKEEWQFMKEVWTAGSKVKILILHWWAQTPCHWWTENMAISYVRPFSLFIEAHVTRACRLVILMDGCRAVISLEVMRWWCAWTVKMFDNTKQKLIEWMVICAALMSTSCGAKLLKFKW